MSDEPAMIRELRALARERGGPPIEAYVFLYQSLERAQQVAGAQRHVSGRELMEGFRLLALETFDALALTVLNAWGLRCTGDVGGMVFALVDRGLMGKTDEDRPEDFQDVYRFEEAFDPEVLARQAGLLAPLPPLRPVRRPLPSAERPNLATS